MHMKNRCKLTDNIIISTVVQNMLYSNVSHEYKSKKLLTSSRRES